MNAKSLQKCMCKMNAIRVQSKNTYFIALQKKQTWLLNEVFSFLTPIFLYFTIFIPVLEFSLIEFEKCTTSLC